MLMSLLLNLLKKITRICPSFYVLPLCLLLSGTSAWAQLVPGKVDSTFGINGRVKTDIGGRDNAPVGMGLQQDGKIIVVQNYVDTILGRIQYCVVRYLDNGRIDTSFQDRGMLKAPSSLNEGYRASCVLVLPDGKIILAGTYGSGTGHKWFVARYHINGKVDSSFGTNGRVNISWGTGTGMVHKIIRLRNGMLVAAGNFNQDVALTRITANGVPDGSFGVNGLVRQSFSPFFDFANDIKELPDSSLIAGGVISMPNMMNGQFALLKYKRNGTLDSTFGMNGTSVTTISSISEAISVIALQPDGKILAGGSTIISNVQHVALMRFNINGTLDNTFGSGGKITAPLGSNAVPTAKIIMLPNGKILLAADSSDHIAAPKSLYLSLLVFNPDGTPDNSFGNGGRIHSKIGFYNTPIDMVQQADGKIIVCNIIEDPNGEGANCGLIRFYMTEAIKPNAIVSVTGTTGQLILYPIPATHLLTIDTRSLGNTAANSHFRILNISGQVMQEGVLSKTNITPVDLKNSPKGQYILVVDAEDRSIKKMFMVL